jgi:hypothetical protein
MWQPFTGSHEVETSPYTRKKSWQPKIDGPSCRLRWSHSSSHATALEWGREVLAQWLHNYISLLGTYHQHAIGTFNTCLWGPTHRSLTDTSGGYNLGGASLPHIHSVTIPTSCLHFPLMAPLRTESVTHITRICWPRSTGWWWRRSFSAQYQRWVGVIDDCSWIRRRRWHRVVVGGSKP